MMTRDPIVIPLSKSKIFVWLIGANMFVGAGGWLLFGNPTFDNALLDNTWFIKTVGLASLVFFGMPYIFLLAG